MGANAPSLQEQATLGSMLALRAIMRIGSLTYAALDKGWVKEFRGCVPHPSILKGAVFAQDQATSSDQ
jgi:hypothetical protein